MITHLSRRSPNSVRGRPKCWVSVSALLNDAVTISILASRRGRWQQIEARFDWASAVAAACVGNSCGDRTGKSPPRASLRRVKGRPAIPGGLICKSFAAGVHGGAQRIR